MAQRFPGINDDEITNVDRNTFRQGLLAGLPGTVHFGRTVTGYRITDAGRVRVAFADGGHDEGDVLVGADGVGSAVRRGLLPHATVRDLGLRCVYGRMALTESTEALVPEVLRRGFSWLSDDTGCGAGFAPVRFRSRPQDVPDYLMITLLATPERLGRPDEELFRLPPEDLWKLTTDLTAGWDPGVRELFARADRDGFFPITIRAGVRVESWRSGPVTLLGDAVHTMPPTGGVGANTALQDAATLAGELLAAARGEQSIADAVAAYERVMLPRGFDTIDDSLRMAARLFGSPPADGGPHPFDVLHR
ncbi:FAD-dependent monooxygenase [Nonomuraea sp. NPDC050643]|uniref:FAD-dependent oxidoreductase n=1 Tax=Nonomuraea sp. NPDC050643 TaxID=3155660 RepID=UPI0033DF8B22